MPITVLLPLHVPNVSLDHRRAKRVRTFADEVYLTRFHPLVDGREGPLEGRQSLRAPDRRGRPPEVPGIRVISRLISSWVMALLEGSLRLGRFRQIRFTP